MKKKELSWFSTGWVIGTIGLSVAFGSVPKTSKITDDTAIYQNLSEIHVKKVRALDFESDLSRLSSLEKDSKYRESLPSPVSGPMNRIAKQQYQFNVKAGQPKSVRR